jgi:hypothetical protein
MQQAATLVKNTDNARLAGSEPRLRGAGGSEQQILPVLVGPKVVSPLLLRASLQELPKPLHGSPSGATDC